MPAVPPCFMSIQPLHLDCRINLCKALQCMRKRHLDLSLVKGRSAHCKQAEHRSPLRHPGSASATDPSEKQQHRLYHGYLPSLSLKDKKKTKQAKVPSRPRTERGENTWSSICPSWQDSHPPDRHPPDCRQPGPEPEDEPRAVTLSERDVTSPRAETGQGDLST